MLVARYRRSNGRQFRIVFVVAAEIVDADAEQANRPRPGVGLVEQADGARDRSRFVARRRRRVAARDRREIAVAHLDRHRSRQQLSSREPADGVRRHLGDLARESCRGR